MKYEAIENFSGVISMVKGEVREIPNESLANDLMNAKLIKKFVVSDSKELEEELEISNKKIEELENQNKQLLDENESLKLLLEESMNSLKSDENQEDSNLDLNDSENDEPIENQEDSETAENNDDKTKNKTQKK